MVHRTFRGRKDNGEFAIRHSSKRKAAFITRTECTVQHSHQYYLAISDLAVGLDLAWMSDIRDRHYSPVVPESCFCDLKLKVVVIEVARK